MFSNQIVKFLNLFMISLALMFTGLTAASAEEAEATEAEATVEEVDNMIDSMEAPEEKPCREAIRAVCQKNEGLKCIAKNKASIPEACQEALAARLIAQI